MDIMYLVCFDIFLISFSCGYNLSVSFHGLVFLIFLLCLTYHVFFMFRYVSCVSYMRSTFLLGLMRQFVFDSLAEVGLFVASFASNCRNGEKGSLQIHNHG